MRLVRSFAHIPSTSEGPPGSLWDVLARPHLLENLLLAREEDDPLDEPVPAGAQVAPADLSSRFSSPPARPGLFGPAAPMAFLGFPWHSVSSQPGPAAPTQGVGGGRLRGGVGTAFALGSSTAGASWTAAARACSRNGAGPFAFAVVPASKVQKHGVRLRESRPRGFLVSRGRGGRLFSAIGLAYYPGERKFTENRDTCGECRYSDTFSQETVHARGGPPWRLSARPPGASGRRPGPAAATRRGPGPAGPSCENRCHRGAGAHATSRTPTTRQAARRFHSPRLETWSAARGFFFGSCASAGALRLAASRLAASRAWAA